jgi:integrase/recombinase XerC
MAGRRSLTVSEERQLLRTIRKIRPRDRALITTQWLTGFRIHEVLSLTIGQVVRDGQFLPKIGVAPRNLKGGFGRTRWIPILPELERALRRHLHALGLKFDLDPDLPLFPSRQAGPNGCVRPLGRSQANDVIKAAFAKAGIQNDGRLGTHTLRKTFAKNVYANAGNDIMVLRRALGHVDVSATQRYLEADEDAVMDAIARCDFTRRPRRQKALVDPAYIPAHLSAPIAA